MEIVSNEQKKSLFLRLIEECKKGNTLRSYKEGNPFSDAGYYDYGNGWKIKNNGILGLWYTGLDEEGKNRINLICGGSIEEKDKAVIDEHCVLTRSFSDDELQEFLDRFFDMNNMEAINEFSSGNRFFTENETYSTPYNTDNSLEYLNILDYINELSGGIDMQNANVAMFNGGDVLPVDYIQIAQNFPGFTIESRYESKYEPIYIKFDQNPDTLQYELSESDGNIEQILSIIQKAISDVQNVYQALRTGTYKRADFVPMQKSEHTATEIGEGVSDIKLEEFTQGLQEITSGDIQIEQGTPSKE